MASVRREVFQVVPLYLGDDKGVGTYFNEHREEIHEVTGSALIVTLAASVRQGDAADVVSATDSTRYPGLKVDDLPCLWVESKSGHFVVALPDEPDAIKRIIRALAASAKESDDIKGLQRSFSARGASGASSAQVPPWFHVAGFASLFLTLLFFMGLVVVSLMGKEVPPGSRGIVVMVLALGLALATSFLGGSAAASGGLPFPFAQNRPIQFSATGGLAVFLISLIAGYYLYVKDDDGLPTPEPTKTPIGLNFSERADSRTPSASLTLVFDDGSSEVLTKHTDGAGKGLDFVSAQVSKDCRYVTFSSFSDTNQDDFIDFKDEAHAYLYDVKAARSRRLTVKQSGVPSWSPDSRYFAYRDEQGGTGEVWIMDLERNSAKQITQNAKWAGHVKWSPNGQYISFYSRDADDSYLTVVRPNGTDFRRLSSNVGNGWGTVWTADNEIAFSVNAPPSPGLYLARPQGGQLQPRGAEVRIEDRERCGWPQRSIQY